PATPATTALTTASAPTEVLRAIRLGLAPLDPVDAAVGVLTEEGDLAIETLAHIEGRTGAWTGAALEPHAGALGPPAGRPVRLGLGAPLPGPAVVRDGRARWWGSADAALAEFPSWPGLRDNAHGAACSLPLVGDDGVRFGFLTAIFPGPGDLPGADRALVSLIARQTAQALYRTRLQEAETAELHRAVALQEATASLSAAADRADVVRAMVVAGRRVLAADRRAPVLAHGDELVLEASSGVTAEQLGDLARRPRGAGTPLTVAVAEGRAIHLDQPDAVRARVPEVAGLVPGVPLGALLAVPLPALGQPGALMFLYRVAHRTDTAALAVAGTLAQLCVQALRRAEHAEDERARRRTAERMQEAIASLTATSTTVDVARSALGMGTAVLGAASVTITVLDPEDPTQLRLVDHLGLADAVAERNAAIPLDAGTPLATAARTGTPVYVGSPEELAADYPVIVADASSGGRASWASLPLVASGRTFGVLGFGYGQRRAFPPDERLALETFASRCAEALGRAERFEAEHQAAVQLQRALLPVTLDAPDGVGVAARYLPGVRGLMVGGDWYDVSLMEDGRVACSVGDVVGQGTAAAAAMGQLRVTLRALAPFAGPADVLTRLEQLSGTIPGAHMATVAHLVLEPGTGEVCYSLAGHPPPVLRRPGGRVTLLEGGRGTPLAPELGQPRAEAAVRLEPGSLLLLYTDGLIERRDRSIDDGLDQLVAAVARDPEAGPEAVCDTVLAELLGGEHAADDVALLCLELLASPRLELRAPARPESLPVARQALRAWLASVGATQEETTDLVLAAGEACANAVEHAEGVSARAELRLDAALEVGELARDVVRITVRDAGRWVERPARPGRGLGLDIMVALVDGLDLGRGTGEAMGTTVTLRRRLGAPAAPASVS
ncbi:MAG: SpoIIE family protein phosphatase, partial [Acidimicrobiia bacterium]|nr:SpoIIE family protein phosphatase [Acidimicrobiia bacterium]